jgi:hypothetical protein
MPSTDAIVDVVISETKPPDETTLPVTSIRTRRLSPVMGVVWTRTTTVTATGPTTRAPIFGRLGENPQGETPTERKINEYTDDLRDLADSDLPAAWVAEELLAVVDDQGDAV